MTVDRKLPMVDGFYTVYPKVLEVGATSFANQTTYGVQFKPTQESPTGRRLLNSNQ
jgi:hypothetical protein